MRTSQDLSPLVKDIVASDAMYFVKNRFISRHLFKRMLSWLNGNDDRVAPSKAAEWLESDAEYFEHLADSLCRHHWYIYPLMWVMMKVVPARLRHYANKLKED